MIALTTCVYVLAGVQLSRRGDGYDGVESFVATGKKEAVDRFSRYSDARGSRARQKPQKFFEPGTGQPASRLQNAGRNKNFWFFLDLLSERLRTLSRRAP